MGSDRETIEAKAKAHKPADSGVAVGNDARCCSLQEVTFKRFKQALSSVSATGSFHVH